MTPDVDLPPIRILSLASGGGGLDLGVEAALARLGRTSLHVAYAEIEAYACAILASRMERGELAPAPIATDVRRLDGRQFAGVVDLLIAGYPCQPWSVAGKRLGAADPRHLWPRVAELIRKTRAPVVFFENVSGHLSLGGREVIGELHEMGYRTAAGLFTAEEVGAPHKRERLFILGMADTRCVSEHRIQSVNVDRSSETVRVGRDSRAVVDSTSSRCTYLATRKRLISVGPRVERASDPLGARLEGSGGVLEAVPFPPDPNDADGWREYLAKFPGLKPAFCRGADGMENRIDRLRLLGNGVVPAQACFAFLQLWGAL